jgi:hypothetical protein
MGTSVHGGSYLPKNIQLSTVKFNVLFPKHNKKLYLSEQSVYSSLTIPRAPQQSASTGLSQAGFSTHLKTALSSSLSACTLTLDYNTALHSDKYSLPVQISVP